MLLLFLFAGGGFLKAPMSANGAGHMSLKAASNLLHFSIETVDANHDGSTDSVIHFDPSNSVTLLGVANLTAHDFPFLIARLPLGDGPQQRYGLSFSRLGLGAAPVSHRPHLVR